MTRLPRRLTLRQHVALVFLAACLLLGRSMWAGMTFITVSPTFASTNGGTVIGFGVNLAAPSTTIASVTLDGIPMTVLVGGPGNSGGPALFRSIVAPAHAAGPVALVVTANDGSTVSTTITYVDMPLIGAATPIERVSLDAAGQQGTARSNKATGSVAPSPSGAGDFVAFLSDTDLGLGTTFPGQRMYVKNRATGELSAVTVCDCPFPPPISLDGTRVVWRTGPPAMGVFYKDAPFTGSAIRVDVDGAGNPVAGATVGFSPVLSGNGQFVAFLTTANLDANPGDPVNTMDLFVRDLTAGVTERWTLGADDNPPISISADGRYVVIATSNRLLPADTNSGVDLYLIDRSLPTGNLRLLISPTLNVNASSVALSAGGSVVAFNSAVNNLVPGDTAHSDTFVLDLRDGSIARVSVRSDGTPSSAASVLQAISGNGRRIAFTSTATNLTSPAPPAGTSNLYVHDRTTGQTLLVAAADDATFGDAQSSTGLLTPDGRQIALSSLAANLVAGDTNALSDVFMKTLPPDVPVGTAVRADPFDPLVGQNPVTLIFDNVTSAGHASIAIGASGPALPPGFVQASPYYDLATDAATTGTVQVCASYLGETISAEGTLRLLHWGGTAWIDITTLADTVGDLVCGRATSLSPFTLAAPPPGYLSPPPAIVTVTPNTGTTAGGTSITIGGSGFQAGATVTLGGIVVVPSSISATSIALLTPAHATGAVSLRVTNPDGQTTIVAAAFTYTLAPAITSVAPSLGTDIGNTLVTITGQNFVAGATVNFGTLAATQVTVVNATTITARTPVLPSTVAPAVVVDVTVTTANGTAVLPGGFTYNVFPRLTTVSPPEGPPAGGTLVILRGLNFAPDATVTFDGIPAASVHWFNSIQLEVTTPAHAVGLVGVSVQTVGGTRSATIPNSFSYGAPFVVGALGPVVRASLASDGSQSSQAANALALGGMSGNGRFVVFTWAGNGLVPGDTNGRTDLFVRDLVSATTEQVNLDNAGLPVAGAAGPSTAAITADGRYVAFATPEALVAGDTNNQTDVYLRDRVTGTTERVSLRADGTQITGVANFASISDDGRHVAFVASGTLVTPADTNPANDVFVRDRVLGTTVMVSVTSGGAPATNNSSGPWLSGDGRFVLFNSSASNLVTGLAGSVFNLFVRDRDVDGNGVFDEPGGVQTALVTAGIAGGGANANTTVGRISADGRFILYTSTASNLVPNDTNGVQDVFLFDRQAASVVRISVGMGGAQTTGVSDVAGLGTPLTADGRWAVFHSSSTNLVPFDGNNNQDVFLFDRQSGTLTLVSARADGSRTDTGGSGVGPFSQRASISADGTRVYFLSAATNLVAGDTNVTSDHFVKTIAPGVPNGPPAAQDGVVSTQEDLAVGGTLSATDPDSNALSFTVVAPPSHGAVTITNATPGAFTYTPAANYNGADGFTFRASDGFLNSNTATVTISVSAVDDGPVAWSLGVTTQEGVATTGTLTAIDAEGDPMTFSLVTPPAKGTLIITDAVTGAFTYTPNAGAVGYDSFVFRAAGGASSTATGSVFIVASAPRWPGQTVRVSVASDGTEGNGSSIFGGIPSGDGRFIVFNSEASNLVAGDTNGAMDVFVHDRQTGQTTRVSVASDGTQGNDHSLASDVSPDGRYVAFSSLASNLVAGDTNGQFDALVHDRHTGQTTRISVASDGTQGNGESVLPTLSADGRLVAFYGLASNLVPGDTNGTEDVFVHDRQTGQTARVSVASNGWQGSSHSWRPAMSADGRFVAFNSEAPNLVAGDTNGRIDVFVHDRQTGQTTRVSVDSTGAPGNNHAGVTDLSADGRHVVLHSVASNLVAGDTNGVEDVFVHDRQTGQTTRVSVASSGAQSNGATTHAHASADGRFVVIQSSASNLVPGDTNGVDDVFVHDRQTGQTVRVSVASDGSEANAASQGDPDFGSGLAISADGRWIAFPSDASNLVASDTNGTSDMFVAGGASVSPTTVSVPAAGASRSVSVSFDYPGSSWTATTTTPWITIAPPGGGTGNGSVEFTVAPNTGPARSGTLVVALQTVTVDQEALSAPVAQNGLFTTPEDTAVSGTLGAIDPNGDALTFSLVSNGALGTAVITDAATGAFTYTPNANAHGADSFTFRANDGTTDSNVATVSVTISPVNDAPVASDGTLTTSEDTPAAGVLAATDIDSPALTYFIVTTPAKGTVTITNATTGAYTYTPAANANGADSFTFRAGDGTADSNVATVAVTIAPADDAPVARSGVVTTREGTAVTGSLGAFDVDGDALTFSVGVQPAQGVVAITDATTGAFTYTPNTGAIGYDPFTFTVSDGSSSTSASEMVYVVANSLRWPGQTVRASGASAGALTSTSFAGRSLSADGRFVAFASAASNLVAGDTNGAGDAFVLDRQTGQTTRVSVASDGTQANSGSSDPTLSADGRFVVFRSNASNLVSGDTNGLVDVFVHDRQTGQTTRASVATGGAQSNTHVFLPATMSAEGRFVAFASPATNLVAGDTNGTDDVFVHDRQTGETTRVSVASDGSQANNSSVDPRMSADGRFVAFQSGATNLVLGDTNGGGDIFVHDRQTGQTTRVSVASTGAQGGNSIGPEISADGRFVAFASGSFLVAGDTTSNYDMHVHDRQTGQTTRVSVASDGTQADLDSVGPSLSADGRYVAFLSSGTNLVAGDTNAAADVFVHDRQTGQTVRVSVGGDGAQANGENNPPALSADGRFVWFTSAASNLVTGDTNDAYDVFVVGGAKITPVITWSTPAPITYGTALSGAQLNATADVPGTFTYAPAIGTSLQAGVDQPLLATFTPTDTTTYENASATVNLTVLPATLTMTPDDKTKVAGTPNPPLTYTIGGFVLGETAAVVSGAPQLSTPADDTSPAGTYPINAALGTLSAANYTFAFATGTLTVTPSSVFLCGGYVHAPETIHTFAGSGVAGFGGDAGLATGAGLNLPFGTAVGDGVLFLADTNNHRVRRVNLATCVIDTVAGTGTPGFLGDNGPATSARLNAPRGVAVAGTVLFIADTNNHRVRRVDLTTGVITTVAGSGDFTFGGDDGPATAAGINGPFKVTVADGVLYIADRGNHRIRRVDLATGTILTIAGNGTAAYGGDGGAATSASLSFPSDMGVAGGALFIADYANNRVRRVDLATGTITTAAGTGGGGLGTDGPAATGSVWGPSGIAVDGAVVLIAEENGNRVRRLDVPASTITTLAGTGVSGFSGDAGPAAAAQVRNPQGVAVGLGAYYIADTFNHRIRQVDALVAQAPLVVTGAPSSSVIGTRFVVAVAGGSGAGVVTLDATGACGADDQNPLAITITAPLGTCTLTATKSGDAHYRDVSATPVVVNVIDSAPPVVVIVAPDRDNLLTETPTTVAVDASDNAGVVGVTVNGVPATLVSGSFLSGRWEAAVPGDLLATSLAFSVSAADAAGNPSTASLVIDNDGIATAIDRARNDHTIDQSAVYSLEFNDNTTSGRVSGTRGAYLISPAPSSPAVRVQLVGSGVANARICGGADKYVRLDTTGEAADASCAGNTVAVTAVSASPSIEVYKQTTGVYYQTNTYCYSYRCGWFSTCVSCYQTQTPVTYTYYYRVDLAAGQSVSTGSPVVADPSNTTPIVVTLVQVMEDGAEAEVGSFQLDPGESAEVTQITQGADRQDTIELTVHEGTVTATINGQTQQLGEGAHTVQPELTPPVCQITSTASNPTGTSPIPVAVTFTEPVFGFGASSIVVQNATIANFAGSGQSFTFHLVPSGFGLVSATVPAGAASDSAGNALATPAMLTRTFVQKLGQSVTFAPIADTPYSMTPVTLTASASSGLTVSFAAAGSCSVAGRTLTHNTTGVCTVTASQAGNDLYHAAPDVVRTFQVLPSLAWVGEGRAWLGLKNSDDQGTRFDLRVEILRGGTLLASGLTRCITGVTRNANNALEAIVPFAGLAEPVPVTPGEVLTVRYSTRIGTNADETFCGGHSNATGLRLYFDAPTRASRVSAQFAPGQPAGYFLHQVGSALVVNAQAPTGVARQKDSAPVTFAGANPWKTVGDWTLTVP